MLRRVAAVAALKAGLAWLGSLAQGIQSGAQQMQPNGLVKPIQHLLAIFPFPLFTLLGSVY